MKELQCKFKIEKHREKEEFIVFFFFFRKNFSENVDINANLRVKVRAVSLPSSKSIRLGEFYVPLKSVAPLGTLQQWYFVSAKTVQKNCKQT